VLKMLADECKKQDMRLFFYYSHLDWHHTDYYPRGRTGEYSNRPNSGDFNKYIDYMNAQIAELCSGEYGEIGGIWFDGWWDQQLKKPGEPVKKTQVEWRLEETYDLIHELQPQALIGNNHHVAPFPGEDFQMFEKDLPGHNTTGFSGDAEIGDLPLETCETMNNSWGYNKDDKNFKSTEKLIQCLVRAAGYNANFLLNVGPMPNGQIQPEFVKHLDEIGKWMAKNGDSIYGTRGGPIEPAENYVATCKDDKIYLHILDWKGENRIFVPSVLKKKVKRAWKLDDGTAVQIQDHRQGLIVNLPKDKQNNIDTIIALAQRTFGAAYQFVPPMSVTLGVKQCLSAKKVRIFSDTGAWKQTALRVALFSDPTPEYPMTLLQKHPDALITATVETASHPISENPDWELF